LPHKNAAHISKFSIGLAWYIFFPSLCSYILFHLQYYHHLLKKSHILVTSSRIICWE
jgi:hypothetical protein